MDFSVGTKVNGGSSVGAPVLKKNRYSVTSSIDSLDDESKTVSPSSNNNGECGQVQHTPDFRSECIRF